jgi:hypothetical protein
MVARAPRAVLSGGLTLGMRIWSRARVGRGGRTARISRRPAWRPIHVLSINNPEGGDLRSRPLLKPAIASQPSCGREAGEFRPSRAAAAPNQFAIRVRRVECQRQTG